MNTLKLVEHDSDRSSDGSFSLYLTIDGVEFELYGEIGRASCRERV